MCSLSFSNIVLAEARTDEQITQKVHSVNCEGYSLSVTSFELDPNIQPELIRTKTAGHFGNPYLVKQEIVFTHTQQVSVNYAISEMQPEYERVSSTRYYSGKVEQCSADGLVVMSFWSGGNCKDVCEVWGAVTFSPQGYVLSKLGLTFAQFKQKLAHK